MRVLFVSCFVVIIDQISKLLVKGISIPFLKINHPGLLEGKSIPLVSNLFNITFVENPGIAFGITFGENYKLIISIFTVIASLLLVFFLYINRKKEFTFRLSIALIIGGAFGNLIDRIFYGVIYGYGPLFFGKVVDFFNMRFFNMFFLNKTFGNYVFNLADVSVTLGVILLLFAYNKRSVEVLDAEPEIPNYLADNKE